MSIRRLTRFHKWRQRFSNTLGNEVPKTLVFMLSGPVAEVEPKTLRNTLADVMTEAIIDLLADTVAEVEAETKATHWPT